MEDNSNDLFIQNYKNKEVTNLVQTSKNEEKSNNPAFLQKSYNINEVNSNKEISEINYSSFINEMKGNIIPTSISQQYNNNKPDINNLNDVNFNKENFYLKKDFKYENEINIKKDNKKEHNIINNTDNNEIISKNKTNIDLKNYYYPVNINLNQYFNLFPNQNQNINQIGSQNNYYENLNNNNNNNFKPKTNIIQNYYNNNNKDNQINKIGNIELIITNIDIILSLLSNYKGSIFLQNSLNNIDGNKISILLKTISPQICYIMCLEFGNYFLQKLIKKLNVEQKLRIYQLIDDSFLYIATNKSGTHVIQSLIDSIQTPLEQLFLNKLLNKNMLLLFNNENGYHIIMKIILEKPENQRDNINLFIVSNIEKIIINPYGAYCVNKFILNNSNLNLRLLMIKNIQNNIKNLIFNKSSCSVLILAIKQFGVKNFEFIIQEIKNNLQFLTLHPISFLFVGKIFHYLKNSEYSKLSSIIWDIYRNDNLINSLCSHKNGNKFLKSLMEYSNNTQKKYIKAKINFIKKSQ